MIDNKKIEEAAYEARKKDCPDATSVMCVAFNQGFKAGINWFLENLWHDASEEPNEGERIFVERTFTGEKSYAEDTKKSLYNSWQTKVNREKITRWLYIEDLMKGEK